MPNRLCNKGHGEGHHDCRTQPLPRPGGNQQPERGGGEAGEDRGHGEQEDSGQ